MKNLIVENSLVGGDAIYFTTKQKLSILNEAMLGIKSLSVILAENAITEKEFYLWKDKYINLSGS